MQRSHTIFGLLLFPLGFALLLGAAFFQGGTALSDRTRADRVDATSSPTPDRLAEPTLPVLPSRADIGAQVYWLHCSACHGDQGQGLTDEFRQLYPPEDQNCWTSHCHGKIKYENGFTIPTIVPPVISGSALKKFPNAAVLFAFMKAAMPFQKPGSLSDEEYYQIESYLLRENGLWTAPEGVTRSNAASIKVGPPAPTATPQPAGAFTSMAGAIPFAAAVAIVVVFIFVFARRSSPK